MPDRTADEIQLEIEQARDALAAAVDELVVRANPKRLQHDLKQRAIAMAQTPVGKAVIGGTAAVLVLMVIGRVRRGRMTAPAPLQLPAGVYQVH